MKKIIFLLALILAFTRADAHRIVVYEVYKCNPGVDNNFDWVSGVSTNTSSEPLVWKGVAITELKVTIKTISCDDPGAIPCVFPGYQSPAIDYNVASQYVAEQIAMGNEFGHVYADGSPGTLTPSTAFNGANVLGPCFMWETVNATCNRTFIIIEENEE